MNESGNLGYPSSEKDRAQVTVELPGRTPSPASTETKPTAEEPPEVTLPNVSAQGRAQEGENPVDTTGNAKRISRLRSGWSPEQIIQAFKEIVTAILAIALMWFTLRVALQTLQFIGEAEKISDAKDILLLMLGLAGVVIGYYFGRVPADARAAQAQEQAVAATAKTEQVSAKAQEAADEARRVIRRPATGVAGATRGSGSPEGTIEAELDRLQKVVDELDRLSRT